jgi:hypothetical protein
MGGACLYHGTPVGAGKMSLVFGEDKDIEVITLARAGPDQMLVAQGKGVAVHDRGADLSLCGGYGKGLQEGTDSVTDIFHQQNVSGFYHGVEEKVPEQKLVGGLGVQEQMPEAGPESILPEGGQQGGGQILALVHGVNGNAFEQISLPGTGGQKLAVFKHQHRPFAVFIRRKVCAGHQGLPEGQVFSLQMVCNTYIHRTISLSASVALYYTSDNTVMQIFFE